MGLAEAFKMMRQKDVAELLDMTESWVEQSRLRGCGPPYVKIGRSVRYEREQVLKWVESQRRYSTSMAV